MKHLIFATNNQHKVVEMNLALKGEFSIISLKEAGIDIDIPEPFNTLEENATTKSQTIYKLTNNDCFSEDTGLEVDVLNGEPGVRSARYAGDNAAFSDNIDKLLDIMKNAENRNAQFKTIISLLLDGKEYLFEGICKGTILTEKLGGDGFGYDPIFVPEGSTKSFAEMTIEEKNIFSHRRKAADKLGAFLAENKVE
jgi:XTP/dITP diphosphohydrolase